MMSNRIAISKEFHQQGSCMDVEFVRKLTNGKRLDAVIRLLDKRDRRKPIETGHLTLPSMPRVGFDSAKPILDVDRMMWKGKYCVNQRLPIIPLYALTDRR
jgi:hypothetical protein